MGSFDVHPSRAKLWVRGQEQLCYPEAVALMHRFLGAPSPKVHPGGCALVVLVQTAAPRATSWLLSNLKIVLAPDHRPESAKHDSNEIGFASTTPYT